MPPQTICAQPLCLSAVVKSLQLHLARSIVWSYRELRAPPVLLPLHGAHFIPALMHSQTEANCWGQWLSRKSTQVEVSVLHCWWLRNTRSLMQSELKICFENVLLHTLGIVCSWLNGGGDLQRLLRMALYWAQRWGNLLPWLLTHRISAC